ncbi:non-canonical purine NTP pyrophosphatase [Solicola gregarius]|uniref:dITP/XTP pyrophosphatase n=1 Tax=Solicola gregarius TaxID=2908642 RepID=A0AA46TG37_9ACTN|nr:non-canonical purine NTP pyrophosphatase [Solicola gregarius]UYM04172.1 non-canonical purine NTP pyrophosphatase [Solicola gregarius]
MSHKVVLASHNPGKLVELRRIFEPHVRGVVVLGLDDVGVSDEPAETEPTFEGNALIKARAARDATQLPSLADDSGICVDALNGMPGVLSARWSGPAKDNAANNALLLAQLDEVPDERRGAQFRCVVALCLPDGREFVQEGVMPGRVLRTEQGSGGFGYDPVFAADGYDRDGAGNDVSTAELTSADKDAISHRGKALRAIAPVVAEHL